MLDELNREEFPSVDELVRQGERNRIEVQSASAQAKRFMARREGSGVSLEPDPSSDDEPLSAELDEAEVERLAKEMMDKSEVERTTQMDEEEREEAEDAGEDEPVEDKWHLGKLLRCVGVEPGMFGWDEELEDFAL